MKRATLVWICLLFPINSWGSNTECHEIFQEFQKKVSQSDHTSATEIAVKIYNRPELSADQLLELGEYIWTRGRYTGDFQLCSVISILAFNKDLSKLPQKNYLDFAIYSAYGEDAVKTHQWLSRLGNEVPEVFNVFFAYLNYILGKQQEADHYLQLLSDTDQASWQILPFFNEVFLTPAYFQHDRAFIYSLFERLKLLTGFQGRVVRCAATDHELEMVLPNLNQLRICKPEMLAQLIKECIDLAILKESRIARNIVIKFGSLESCLDLYRRYVVKTVGNEEQKIDADPIMFLWGQDFVTELLERFRVLRLEAMEDMKSDTHLQKLMAEINGCIEVSHCSLGYEVVMECGNLGSRLGLAEILFKTAQKLEVDSAIDMRQKSLSVYKNVILAAGQRNKVIAEELGEVMSKMNSKPSDMTFAKLPVKLRSIRNKGLVWIVATLSGKNSTGISLANYVSNSPKQIESIWQHICFKDIEIQNMPNVFALMQLSSNPMSEEDMLRYACLDFTLNGSNQVAKSLHNLLEIRATLFGAHKPEEFSKWFAKAKKLI